MIYSNASGVVLTTTWKDLTPEHEDFIYLKDGLSNCGIEILGQINEPSLFQRGMGILNYLKDNPEIDEYVILDDQHFDFDDDSKLWENYLDTQGRGIENAVTASKTPTVTAIDFCDLIKKYSLIY